MRGNDIYKRALNLLGYLSTDSVTVGEDRLLTRAPSLINQICIDLKIDGLELLSDSISATPEKADALCYGTAMLLALSEGDGVKNQLFAEIYNAKRAKALSKTETVADNLPTISYGVD